MSRHAYLAAPFFLALLFLVPAGCGGGDDVPEPDCTSVADTTIVPTVSYAADIVPLYAENKYGCQAVACHGGGLHSSNYSLESYAEVFQRGDQARDMGVCAVRPGAPDESYLLWKMEGRRGIRGEPMPNGCRNSSDPFDCVTPEDLQLVRTWIQEGALDN